ncbi:MAG: tRNA preQ1(34) S-adenosylmethionine ribosyltransferase-isomerase QueA [bacterium]|nr:tRNA preQ1(34) S-adenosylmethionine ribosyltransferase-isomerase QueA [bacterium]
MKLSDFDYHLPPELIAQRPLSPRDQSRLLVLDRASGKINHRSFRDVVDYLNPEDCLVLNETKVIPARLRGIKKESGLEVELLLNRQLGPDLWEALSRPARRIKVGDSLLFNELEAKVVGRGHESRREVRFNFNGEDFWLKLERIGEVPLPPYINRDSGLLSEDRETYQTIYARSPGAVAAPTAGLHFTPELLEAITQKGGKVARLILHVGLGTFQPVRSEDIRSHLMAAEYYEVREKAAQVINATKGRVIAVGTTTVKALESSPSTNGARITPSSGLSDLFIYPPYQFRAIDGLITNFHLPKSTLLMLVSALAGRERIFSAYQEAIRKGYRFFSYGDAMLII